MSEVLARCGYRCDLCLAYRPNIEADPSNRQILSDGWHKYFGFRIPPEQIACDGCMAEDSQRIDKACPVRPCVIQRELANCSECDEMLTCDKLAERRVVFEEMERSFGSPIPEEDRARFIAPYENFARLCMLKAQRS